MIEVNVHDGLDAMKEKLARILKTEKYQPTRWF